MIASRTWLFGAVGLVLAAVGLYGGAYGVQTAENDDSGAAHGAGRGQSSVVAMVLAEPSAGGHRAGDWHSGQRSEQGI